MPNKWNPGCNCCGQRCDGTCTGIIYTSMDIEVLGSMDGYTGFTYVFNSSLIDLFAEDSLRDWQTTGPATGVGPQYYGCDWLVTGISHTHSGYGGTTTYTWEIMIGGRRGADGAGPGGTLGAENRLRVHLRVTATPNSGSPPAGTWRYAKEMFIDDCDDLLIPIDLNYASGGPIPPTSPFNITGIKWNLNL